MPCYAHVLLVVFVIGGYSTDVIQAEIMVHSKGFTNFVNFIFLFNQLENDSYDSSYHKSNNLKKLASTMAKTILVNTIRQIKVYRCFVNVQLVKQKLKKIWGFGEGNNL